MLQMAASSPGRCCAASLACMGKCAATSLHHGGMPRLHEVSLSIAWLPAAEAAFCWSGSQAESGMPLWLMISNSTIIASYGQCSRFTSGLVWGSRVLPAVRCDAHAILPALLQGHRQICRVDTVQSQVSFCIWTPIRFSCDCVQPQTGRSLSWYNWSRQAFTTTPTLHLF